MVISDYFDPLEFLRVAESLAAGDTSEANLRTAVSRTYYAVFLVMRERFEVEGKRNIHGRVIGAVYAYDKMAGERLQKLEALRILADYRFQTWTPSTETGATTTERRIGSQTSYSIDSHRSYSPKSPTTALTTLHPKA